MMLPSSRSLYALALRRAGGLMPLMSACLLIWVLAGEVSGSGQRTLRTGVSSSFEDSIELSAFVKTIILASASGTAMVSA